MHWHVTRDTLAGLISNGAYRDEPAATYGQQKRGQIAAGVNLNKHEGVSELDSLSLDTCTGFARS